MAPGLQFNSQEYDKENMASCPIFTFETTKNVHRRTLNIIEYFENSYAISFSRQLLK